MRRKNNNIINERENLQHKNHIAGIEESHPKDIQQNTEVAYKGLSSIILQQERTEREGPN